MFLHIIRRSLSILAALLLTVLLAPAAHAQFDLGNGGFGGGSNGSGGIETQTLMIEYSKSGKTLYAFSNQVGTWDKLTPQPHPEDGIAPVVSGDFAVLRGKQHLHAFKAETGKWTSIETDSPPSHVVVSSGIAAATAGQHLWAIRKGLTTWVSVDIGEPADLQKLTVSASRVVYRTKTHVYAFSSGSGEWASVDLTKD